MFRTCLLALSASHKVHQGKLNALPFSASSHSGATSGPVYLATFGKTSRGGVSTDVQQKSSRISRSSRTLVPCVAIKFNLKSHNCKRRTRDSMVIKWSGTRFIPMGSTYDLCLRRTCSGSDGSNGMLQSAPYVNFEILPVTKWST